MREYLTQNAVEMGSIGVKTIGAGAVTAIIFGAPFNQAEIQFIGVIVAAIGVVGGLIITAVAKYFEHQLNVRKLEQRE